MLQHPRPPRGALRRPRRAWPAAGAVAPGVLLLAAVGPVLLRPRPAAAQQPQGVRLTGSVDAGAATVAYDDFLRSAVFSIAPAARLETARTALVARGAVSRFESGNSALQATLAGSAISPEVWGVRGEALGTLSTTRYSDSVAATNLFGLGRLHLASPTAGLWGGIGGGFVSQLDLLPNELIQGDFGAWARYEGATFTLIATPTRVGRTGYADVVAASRWQGGRAELAVGGGWRRKWGAIPGAHRWAELSATGWITTQWALVGGVGQFPANVVQGLPGGRYASLGFRFGPRRPLTSDPELRAELTLPYELERLRRRPGGASAFTIAANPDGTRTLRVVLPDDARRVELMSDFTDWTPVELTSRGGGAWELVTVLAPGVHRVNVRVDGGPWIVPAGLTATRDEFGGEVGLLVVQ